MTGIFRGTTEASERRRTIAQKLGVEAIMGSRSARRQQVTRDSGHDPSHIVQFYDQDGFLIEALGRFIGSAIAANDCAIVIATPMHREALNNELLARGLDLSVPAREGRYTCLDAAQVLAEFMVEGWPEPSRFRQAIVPLLLRARSVAKGEGRVSAFGEMVALLWANGKRDAAIRLEQLWNELLEEHSFSLLCAYPMSGFERAELRRPFFSICGEHSLVNPAEDYPAGGSEKQRRRSVARLQQKTRALQAEIRISQERTLLVQRAAGVGTWELDLQDDSISFSSRAAALLGLPAGHLSLSQLTDCMRFSGDRDAFLAALQRARTGRKEFVTEFRVATRGDTRLLCIRGKTIYNSGNPLIIGVVSDVTPA